MKDQRVSFHFIASGEYLEAEEWSDVRHEYVSRRVYAMSGASDKPKVIIEILSESTSQIDRTDKLTNYKRIPTAEEIVLIGQNWPENFIVRRSDRWKKHIYSQFDTIVRLDSVDLKLSVADFYSSSPSPANVERPWHLRHREDG